MSSPLSKDFVEYYGMLVAKSVYSNLVISVFAAGVQCFMALYSLSVFFEAPADTRKGRGPYIAVSVTIFALYTFIASLDITWPFDFLLKASNGADVLAIWKSYPDWRGHLSRACVTLLLILGDGLLLYRCYILLFNCRWLVLFPAFTYFGTIALSIAQNVLAINKSDSIHHTIVAVEGASVGFSVATNVAVTALIVHRLLKARKQVSNTLPLNSYRIYTDVTYILIESAMPLTVSGILFAAVNFARIGLYIIPNVNTIPAHSTFALFYYAFIAISPQMIIFRVTTGRSWLSAHDTMEFSRPIGFASGGTHHQEGSILTESQPRFEGDIMHNKAPSV
ncbi:hypothetical protein FA15DRAFT_620773 [Coprinopsis marcescibilis]|uniref:Fungal pheromone STE3G-protein-coupled receptor n=1 Tax=Coprinopsis marcescibilis TaxID=230819 RepID=A0A5C3KSA0_COPMA|nr:hypothetical protein FA15DRAFT_620773 [Coprinopsis marcescibilis]